MNNNGNVTFHAPLATYVPFGLSATRIPIIAAYFGDLDTRPGGTDPVTYGTGTVDGHRAFGVNYFRSGYFDNHANRLNTFQLILIDRSDTGLGNFDIEFDYAQVQWDLGDAGRTAFGSGVSAVVGFSNGTGERGAVFELPGSMRNGAFLDNGPLSLIRHSLNSEIQGRYIFQARGGTVGVLRIVTPPGLPDGTVRNRYEIPPLQATGGTPPYRWEAVSWPDIGLNLDAASGVIAGTPSRSGTFQLTVRVFDHAGTPPSSQVFTLTVADSPMSRLAPFLIEPRTAPVGVPVRVVAGLRLGDSGPALSPAALPEPTAVEIEIEGAVIVFSDNGLAGDEQAGDGRYSGMVTFRRAGLIPVVLRARNSLVNRTAEDKIDVTGRFAIRGAAPLIDFGTLREGQESCRPVILAADQEGPVKFTLKLLRQLPYGHYLELRGGGQKHRPGMPAILLSPADSMDLCLIATSRAAISDAVGEPWLDLTAQGSAGAIPLRLRWHVDGLTFLRRWWWLLLLLAALALLTFVIYGYIKPYRFRPGIAVTFVPEYEDLDQTPQPLSQWRIRIGWYRDAQAYLHSNFRISNNPQGAVAVLRATADGAWVQPRNGYCLCRERDPGEWQELEPDGRAARLGTLYRIGDQGPFFRVTRGQTR